MKKIIAIVGDYYHKGEWAEEALNLSLHFVQDTEKVELSYVTIDQVEKAIKEAPDLIILFKEDRLNPTDEEINLWMTPEIANAIQNYVHHGGSWLAWHSGLASYDEKETYTKMLRGYFVHHPHEHQQVTYTPIQESTTVKADKEFVLLDEHYFVYCEEEKTEVFLRSTSVDGSSMAGWAHSFGEGKVCCLTPAHNYEGLTNRDFVELLGNSIQWCLEM